MADIKALDLFQAYSEGKLPQEGGYIVSSFFKNNTPYSIYEVVAYGGVKNITAGEEGITFQTDGCKLHVLVEPSMYSKKYIEPVSREHGSSIPFRFNELNIHNAKNQYKIMVPKEPIVTYSSFTVLRPTGINFALCFYNNEEVIDTIEYFFVQTFNREAQVPKRDAVEAAKLVSEAIKKFNIF
ncbi:MAG: hypothetical protein PQJ61_10595 [Spirochaetales bacterium]|uniref:Uncharacterized protein n=1 Tax=Candidatus Thalassospirochaeta sargassi TaxID=3119039 RepID=A0AAJ1IG15_9SPIO|nr:hypothetical protein [Spirochaetales bacterium]